MHQLLYKSGKAVLSSLLESTIPDNSDMAFLYPGLDLQDLKDVMISFLRSRGTMKRKVREHLCIENGELQYHTERLEEDGTYVDVHRSLLEETYSQRTQRVSHFGCSYEGMVLKIIGKYSEFNLKRKCGIPKLAHSHRVSELTKKLQFDQPEMNYHYAMVAFFHDTIEDLFPFMFSNDPEQWNDDYERLIVTYIPRELVADVEMLTNHYDLLLQTAVFQLGRAHRSPSRRNLISFFTEFGSAVKEPAATYIAHILSVLDEPDRQFNGIDTLKWILYKDYYLKSMGEQCHSTNNYRVFQIKAIDLMDNHRGINALGLSSKMKNILKLTYWANVGYSLGSSWTPLNNHVMELQEVSLSAAENMVLEDLTARYYHLDHLTSAFRKIEQLQDVFYTEVQKN